MKRKRTKVAPLHKIVLDAAKDIRKKKLIFEREASAALTAALGFEVTVKIKRTKASDGYTPAMKRYQRKSPQQIAEDLNAAFSFQDDGGEM